MVKRRKMVDEQLSQLEKQQQLHLERQKVCFQQIIKDKAMDLDQDRDGVISISELRQLKATLSPTASGIDFRAAFDGLEKKAADNGHIEIFSLMDNLDPVIDGYFVQVSNALRERAKLAKQVELANLELTKHGLRPA